MAEIFSWILRVLLGGSIYFMLEVLVRGRSHWTMFLLGGVCFALCGFVNHLSAGQLNIWEEMVWCMLIITVLEFAAGLLLNRVLGLYIWDYSSMPLHVMGQICVPFMFLWYLISGPAIWLNRVCDMILRQVVLK